MYVSVRDCHLPGVFGSVKAGLAAMGLDAVELAYNRDKSVTSLDGSANELLATEAAVDAFAYKCDGLKIKPSCLLLANNFGADDIEGELDYVISAVKAAGRLGIKAVRIDAIMHDNREWDLAKRTEFFAECMAKVLDATSNLDVHMGVENHGTLGNQPDFLDTILNKINSPRVGVTIDTANFYWYGYPLSKVREIITHFAPKAKHTHVKNINFPPEKREIQREIGWEYGKYASPLREGDIDMKWLVKTLADAGYKGDLCIENESLGRYDIEKQKAILRDDADYLKEILANLKRTQSSGCSV
ncbi:MAG: sugar phosphate isomerase/epimerase [Armatimonadetes bacterium]|nr:sugar phosphate isomerase/epimerase [Armatimonadota bacterium]